MLFYMILTLLKGMVNIQQRQVITINMCKTHLTFISLFLHLIRSHKTLRDFKYSKKENERTMFVEWGSYWFPQSVQQSIKMQLWCKNIEIGKEFKGQQPKE